MRPRARSRVWKRNPKIARRNHYLQILLLHNKSSNRLEHVVSAIKELAELKNQTTIATSLNPNGAPLIKLQVSI
jgi:hypothetical protein